MISKIINKLPKIPKRGYSIFLILFGVIIVAFNDEFGGEQPYMTIALCYFLSLIVLFLYWVFKQIKMIISLKTENKKAELLHLKNQVNPHFFFNTLNNLYGLVDEDTEKTKTLILKLSDMMSYSIYRGDDDYVTIEEEIIFLEHYIELHKIRYYKNIDITFDVEIIDEGIKVTPLLFINLLENAFKHGVENLRNDAYIKAKLKVSSAVIYFEIENNFDPEEINSQSGIGLKNLQRRLELIYPKKHQLNFTELKNIYKATLTIYLT
ncbi:histidine kinase [uncultured Tenacibaculum sp.]|uniref:sensor histidine kinase n=1 Tax=uncultured Tenacibaculum sp. TaxID=174713 RepID=UPI002617696D|nr:histidine kinase [uncultured Tenacibaculum sp.]